MPDTATIPALQQALAVVRKAKQNPDYKTDAIMETVSKRKPKTSLFITIGLIGFLVVFLGFGKTLPAAIKNSQTPIIVYIHASLAFSWLLLFLVQSFLIRQNNFRLHKKLGLVGLLIGTMISISIIPVALFETSKELSQGLDEIAYSNLSGSISSAIILLTLIIAGIYYRKKKEIHKRFMLLATIFILWPAWFRLRHYFPSNPNNEVWFVMSAFSLIVLAWIWEILTRGKIHATLLYVGLLIILETAFEQFIMYGGKTWVLIGKSIYGLFTS